MYQAGWQVPPAGPYGAGAQHTTCALEHHTPLAEEAPSSLANAGRVPRCPPCPRCAACAAHARTQADINETERAFEGDPRDHFKDNPRGYEKYKQQVHHPMWLAVIEQKVNGGSKPLKGQERYTQDEGGLKVRAAGAGRWAQHAACLPLVAGS